MLSPSSHLQKDNSDEDSSGSDVGLEPETDRFGFIVTGHSTAGSVGPSPELVRQREAKWIDIMVQWDRILPKRTNKVKVQCQKGIPASVRAKCWPLLCGAAARMKQNENLYQCLDTQCALQSWVDVINRDLDRQFPFHEMFLSKDGHGQRGLFRVLKSYTQYKPEEGYCQAQGPVAAVLLMNMPPEEAFWCLVQISEQYLPGYYSPLLEGVLFDAAILDWVLKRMCPAAHKHLQHYGVEPLMFATDWLMCLFTRHLPFNALLRVWDLFFCHGVRVLLQVAVVLVRRVLGRAEQRKKCDGQMETLERLRGIREHVQEKADAFITEVCSVPLSARDLEKQMEKEMKKWKKDRPSSTFDPRHRCTGYQMVWAVARHHQETLEKMERERGHLSLPLPRSASTLSLSPKTWKKGVKVSAGEREGAVRVVRHLSMGAKDEVHFKHLQCAQEDKDVGSQELTEQRKNKKGNLPKITAEYSEGRFEGPFEQEDPRSKGVDNSQIRETVENKKTTEETKLIDLRGNQLQPVEQTEMQSESQAHNLEHRNSEINEQDSQGHVDTNAEQNIEECVQQSVGDSESLGTAPGNRPDSDTATKEAEKSSQRDAGKEKHHSTAPLAVWHSQSAADADGLLQMQEKQEENTKTHLEHSEHLHSQTQAGGLLVPDDTVSESGEALVSYLKASEAGRREQDESLPGATQGVETDESTTQSLITKRSSDCTASPQDTGFTFQDGGMTSVQMRPPKEPADVPQVLETAREGKNTESLKESAVENKVFHPIKLTDSNNDLQGDDVRNSNSTQASSRRSSRSSAEFCIRKSPGSHGSGSGRQLSEDLFTFPHKPIQPQTGERNSGVKHTQSLANLGAVDSALSPPDGFSVRAETNTTDDQQEVPNPPKAFGLFRKLRGHTPKNPKGAPKMQVPKILIQDFSDGTGTEKPIREYKEEKLNSRERRRRQREQERRKKEEQKLRKKTEKEQEMVTEREKKKAQIFGKNLDLQDEKERREYQSHPHKISTSYAELYF